MKKEQKLARFLEKASAKFGDKFDYSKVDYVNSNTNIIVICPIHGEFETTPSKFLQSKHGCRKCSFEESHKLQRKTTEQFIDECKSIWKDKYTYEKVNYIDSDTKVIITCLEHGDFETRPADFIRGHGCPKCKSKIISESNNNKKDTLESFIEKATLVHKNKYKYDKVVYIDSRSPVTITCPKHGDFEQLPSNHLSGNGCPRCNNSKGEMLLDKILNDMSIPYYSQYKIEFENNTYFLDFYIEIGSKKYCIEYHGRQHYEPVEHFGGVERFKKQIIRDYKVREYCFLNNIQLLEINCTWNEQTIFEYVNKLLKC